MIVTTTPNAEYRYRAESAKAPMSHIRKRCACGRVVTARQLAQYQRCDRCLKGNS